MKWRTLIKLMVTIAFFAVCFVMLASVIGYDSPWLGLLLMFYFMGLAKFAEPLFVLHMPRGLQAVDPHGLLDGRLYRWLGVRRFGKLLRTTALRHLNDSVYRSGGRRSLEDLLRLVESAEATHFWAAVLFTPYIVYVLSRDLLTEATIFGVVQILFNVYPILHLRLVRARLTKQSTGSRSQYWIHVLHPLLRSLILVAKPRVQAFNFAHTERDERNVSFPFSRSRRCLSVGHFFFFCLK